MSYYLIYLLASRLTSSPLLTLVMAAALFWGLDHFTLGVLPAPMRLYRRWRRTGRLQRELEINPHNRKSRFELADLLIDQHRHAKALEVLKPNVAAGDSDAATMYLMGVAAYGSGHAKEAETFLGEAAEQDPEYRMGAIYLEQGRGRLNAGDWAGARQALEAFVHRRKGTVEGRVLLARALDALGDGTSAQRARTEAWSNYATSPRFAQREQRWWAWRLQPWRPVALAAAVAGGLGGVAYGAQKLNASGGSAFAGVPGPYGPLKLRPTQPLMTPEQQARYDALVQAPTHPGGGPIDPKRFVRLPNAEAPWASKLRGRWSLNDPDPAHRTRLYPGDMLCRIWALYGKPEPEVGSFTYAFKDTTTGVIFTAYSAQSGPAYGFKQIDLATSRRTTPEELAKAEAAIGAFDQLLDETTPVDCKWTFVGDEGNYESGVRGGKAYASDEG